MAACKSSGQGAQQDGDAGREAGAAAIAGPTRIVLRGNESFDDGTLRAAFADVTERMRRKGPSKAAVYDAAYFIEVYYRDQGFPLADVTYEYLETPGDVLAEIDIVEGPRCEIESLSLVGNTSFPSELLLRFFTLTRDRGLSDDEAFFVENRLRGEIDSLREFYFGNGFLNVRVDPPEVEFVDEGRRAQVEVSIEEGVRFRIADITPGGDLAGEEQEVARILRDFLGETQVFDVPEGDDPQDDEPSTPQLGGRSYRPRALFELRSRVGEHFARNAYPDNVVLAEAELDEDTGDVRIALTVVPGPRVILREVHFEGAESTREGFLRSRMIAKPGQDYDIDKVRQSFRRLYATGLFRTVDIELRDVDADEAEGTGAVLERDLIVRVEESVSREYFVEPGYGSYEGPRVRVGVLERNLFGTGKRVQVESTVGALAQGVSAGLNSPWLFGSQFDGNVTLFANRREEPSFTFREFGISAGVSRQWTRRFQTTFGYQFRPTVIEDSDITPPAGEELQDFDIGSLALTSSWDSRNGFFAPSDGLLARLTLELADDAFGSEVEFVRALYSQAHFWALRASTVVAATFRGGVIIPFGDTDLIPIQERLFNGGENSVRSFREDQLGPRDVDGNPIGGESFTVLSIELRQQVYGALSGALFYDAGTVQLDYRDVFDTDGLGQAFGVGLRYMLPIGPVRLDAAINPDPAPGEDDFVVHLSVGMAF